MLAFRDKSFINFLSSSVNSITCSSPNLFTLFASIIVEKTGKPCLTLAVYSYLFWKIPVISTSSPGRAESTKSLRMKTSFYRGTLPGGTVPGVS
jgi:hypothetical protein